MFTYSYDEPSGVSVGLMSGPENTDDDYARYVALITSPVLSGTAPRRVMYLVVDRDNPAPNAEWRRKIAAASSGYTHRPVFAMITASPFIRGVATALNWIRPPTYDLGTFAEFDPAVRWAERLRGEPLRQSHKMLEQARARATPTSRPSGL